MTATLVAAALFWLAPNVKWLGWVFLCLAVVPLLWLVWRHLGFGKTANDQTRQLPQGGLHINVSPTISPVISPVISPHIEQRSASSHLNIESHSTERKSNIICSKPRPATLVQADWAFYYPQDVPSLKNFTLNAYLIEFENQPLQGRSLDPVNHVEAQIIFYDSANVEHVRVEPGSWVREPFGLVNLEVGRKKALVLFTWWPTKDNELEVVSQQNNRDATNPNAKPTSTPLFGDWLHVYVRLIANGELIKEDNYKLTIKPDFAISLIDPRQEKVEQLAMAQKLNEFLNEGYEILRGNPLIALSAWVVAKEWAAKVENYIRENLGEIHALDFSKEAPIKPYPHPAVNRRVVDWIYTRIERIGELITELKKS